ncbi:peptidoglycan editing factor PgeF [Magnetococcus sp. PR-3]|uniref:peptidoglycan editing factor PgeF n=1 Tax=Magnetococcus sp. PR-3 TaxID=3120355 RepID=UPI002FCE46FE
MLLDDRTFPVLAPIHTFQTDRQGGVSRGNYADLNLGDHVGDNPESVLENRRRLHHHLGYEGLTVLYAQQVHGNTTAIIEGAPPKQPPQADALVTNQPNLVLGMMTADCLPVLFAHPQSGVIGAAHAGWRGAVEGILESCLHGMQRLGAQPDETIAMLGPCIQQNQYEVDGAFYARLLTDHGGNTIFFNPSPHHSDRWMFDLPGFAKRRLQLAGIREANLYDCERCTYQEESKLFSHRRSTHYGQIPCGRQLSGIYRLS